MIENMGQNNRRLLKEGQEFCFECRPGLLCFNSCCRDKRLPLLPYDLLRLKKGLGLDSARILEQYAELEFDPASGWPVLRIKLDCQGRCSFLASQGCAVYAHRPAACRIYPLSRMAAPSPDGRKPSVFFERQATKNCLGWEQSKRHTTQSWVEDQGLEPYNRANDDLLPLLFHPKRKGRMELTPQQIHAVIAALYNLDVFHRMLAGPGLKDMFAQEKLEAAQRDDLTVLELGREFLLKTLFAG